MNKGENLRMKFDHEWSGFRRWIARHPLSGYWSGVGTGVLIGAFVVWVL